MTTSTQYAYLPTIIDIPIGELNEMMYETHMNVLLSG